MCRTSSRSNAAALALALLDCATGVLLVLLGRHCAGEDGGAVRLWLGQGCEIPKKKMRMCFYETSIVVVYCPSLSGKMTRARTQQHTAKGFGEEGACTYRMDVA